MTPSQPDVSRLATIDFGRDIARLTHDYTGREWLLEEIDRWLHEAERRFLVLTGEPGLGKNAFVARLAQVAEARDQDEERRKHYHEAKRYFRHVVGLEPGNAAAHNGLGNIEYALGNLDGAIVAYNRAIELAPGYTAAHHDLALVFEAKMEADPAHADGWCRKALQAWQTVYRLAPDDPIFSADAVLAIGQRISWFKQHCG